jgi:septation ring formation regulator EzrA
VIEIYVLGTLCEAYHCLTCGVAFTVPKAVATNQRENGGYHFCPNGHQQGWSKEQSEVEKLRRERDRLKQQTAQKDDEINGLRAEYNKAEQARAAAARKLATHKKRAAAGTCPCCKRTFGNMAEHMKQSHPEFVAEQGAKVVPIKRTA